MMLETQHIEIKSKTFSFEVYPEEMLTWEQHNEIHRVLNLVYSARSKSFIKKTYAHAMPIIRILCRLDNVLVGHIAIFEDYALVDGKKVKIAGLGMIASLKPMSLIGALLRRKALDICAERGHAFAIGRVRNTPRIKEHLSSFIWRFLEIPLVGKTTLSHPTEILAIFNTGLCKHAPDELISYFEITAAVRIKGEIF